MSLETRYDIQPPIHIGQVATAHPANQRGLNRKVLLKIIHPQWARDTELVERFSREGRAMASVNHPNVVRVYDFGQEGEISYLALEWVDGGTLTDMMRGAPLSQEKIKRIASELLQGLSAVHKAGLLHRDIKPDNLLFTRDGLLKLSDFSLAGFQASSGLTSQGAIIGSPAYLAPELLEGEPAGIASDLYGVGIVLFEALTGSNPFIASDPLVSLDLVRRVKPPKLFSRQQIDPQIARLIDCLLERNPADRPATAGDALAILEGVQTVKVPALVSEPDSIETDLPDPSVPPKVVELTVEQEVAAPPAQSQPSGRKLPVVMALVGAVALVLIVTFYINRTSVELPAQDSDSAGVAETIRDTVVAVVDSPSVDSEPVETFKPGGTDVVEPTDKSFKTGNLTVIAIPWAAVWRGSDSLGVTPLKGLELPEGTHRLRLVHNRYPSVVKDVVINSDKRDTLMVELEKEAGALMIKAVPWGYLWIDGDSLTILPHSAPVWLAPGPHKIAVRHPSLPGWEDQLEVGKGERYRITVNLTDGTAIKE